MADNEKDTGGDSRRRPGRRKRVIGTPIESDQQYMISREDTGGEAAVVTEKSPPEADAGKEQAKKRAERTAAALFLLAGAAGVGFMIAYVLVDLGSLVAVKWSNRWLGLTMAVTFLAMGAGAVVWVRNVMPGEEVVGEREPMPSSMREKAEFTEYFLKGADQSALTKRPLLRRSLLAALVPVGVAPLFLLRGLGGDLPFQGLYHTVWRKGLRLVIYGTGEPVKPENFAEPGSILTVIPEGYEHDLTVLADATVQIIKFRPSELREGTNLNWVVDGIVAYSKICTHVGCATGLYEDTTHYILCPCHQSTFDASRGCKVIFGPASRPLPQLPLGVDNEGYLIALGDFPEPVGPSFWGRGGE